MATEPQKSKLVNLLQDNIDQNNENIIENQSSVKESQGIIDYFDPSCKGLDGRIVSLVGSINTLKSEIVTLYSQAYAVGCGTTAGLTVYQDTAVDSYYNISISSYDSDTPYEISNQTLSSSNVGFGTFVIYTKDNNQLSGIGSAYADIGSCYRGGCVSGNCTNYQSQITTKQNQIITLQAEVDTLIPAINSLKTERVDYQIRRWSDNYTIRNLREENARILVSLGVLNNPQYDQYI
jgi:hypothetical protein